MKKHHDILMPIITILSALLGIAIGVILIWTAFKLESSSIVAFAELSLYKDLIKSLLLFILVFSCGVGFIVAGFRSLKQ